MRSLLIVSAALALPSCSSAPAVAPAERKAAEQWVTRDQGVDAGRPVALWYANGTPGELLCGVVEAPAKLRGRHPTLRYVYEARPGRPNGQLEMHDGWLAAGTVAQSLLAQNQMIFNDTWTRFCAPYAPFTRKVSTLTGINL